MATSVPCCAPEIPTTGEWASLPGSVENGMVANIVHVTFESERDTGPERGSAKDGSARGSLESQREKGSGIESQRTSTVTRGSTEMGIENDQEHEAAKDGKNVQISENGGRVTGQESASPRGQEPDPPRRREPESPRRKESRAPSGKRGTLSYHPDHSKGDVRRRTAIVDSPMFSSLLRQLEEEHIRKVRELQAELNHFRISCGLDVQAAPARSAQLSDMPMSSVSRGYASEGSRPRSLSKAVTLPAGDPALLQFEDTGVPANPAECAETVKKKKKASFADDHFSTIVPSAESSVANKPPSLSAERRHSVGTVGSDCEQTGKTLVKVTIIGARGLRNADWALMSGGSSDPFCVCEVPGKRASKFRTRVIDDCMNPEWNHEAVVHDYQEGDQLDFTVLDMDWGGKTDLLGCVTLPADKIFPNGYQGELKLDNAGPGIQAYLDVKVEVAAKSWTFEHLDVWATLDHSMKKRSVARSQHKGVFAGAGGYRICRSEKRGSLGSFRHAQRQYLIHPESTGKLFWDLMGMFVLLCDIIWIPMQLLSPKPSVGLIALQSSILAYWTLDIGVIFNTAVYTKRGDLRFSRSEILRTYYWSGWLLLDVLLVGMEWVLIVLKEVSGTDVSAADSLSAARAAKVARVARMLRVLRLMRLAKLRQILTTLQTLLDTEWMTIGFTVVRNMGIIFALNHVLACLWFGIGSLSEHGKDGWVKRYDYEDADYGFQYLASLNWSMAQFTPGSSPLLPHTTVERIYYCIVLALGLVVATCFMSNITSTVSALWAMRRHESTQAFLLQKFLKQNGISRSLSARVTRYVDCVLELRHKKVHPSKVQYLTFLSGPLHVQLQSELREPQLLTHQFFPRLKAICQPALCEICITALSQVSFARGDMVFRRREVAANMLFITMGTGVYQTRRNGRGENRIMKLETGHHCCENSLWMPWTHTGRLKALSDADVTLLSAPKFIEVVCGIPDAYMLAFEYARRFLDKLQDIASFDPRSVTDVPYEVAQGITYAVTGLGHDDLREAEDVEADIVDFSDASDSDDETQVNKLSSRSSVCSAPPKV